METINLLWSGGWDGTFRFLQLAEEKIRIQPIYVIDAKRRSTEYELSTMKNICDIVKSDKAKLQFKAEILETQFYHVTWILQNCRDQEISEAFLYLRNKYQVGTQYEWFALLAKYLDIKCEAGVIHQYHGKVEDAINREGELCLIKNDVLSERYQVLPKKENNSVFLVFGNIIFPLLNLTKKDEENIARRKGWLDIMKFTWFCHDPINGEPCGLCGPCDDAMNTGMEWRLPPKARKRHKYRNLYLFVRKVKNHIPFIKKG